MSAFRFKTYINGGLPVVAECDICPAEPDVGLFAPYISETVLYWLPKGWDDYRVKAARMIPDALYRKAEKAGDIDRIEREAFERSADAESARLADYGDWLYEQRRDRMMEARHG